MNIKNSIVPGLALAMIIGYFFEYLHSLIVIGGQKPVSGVIIAIIAGILIKNTIGVARFSKGNRFCVKKGLKRGNYPFRLKS